MPDPSFPSDPQAAASATLDELLAEAPWVRQLARRLVRDSAAAEDLEQATLLAALRSGLPRREALRRWLAAVARNFARTERRGARRREERELRAARAEALPSAAELVERAALHRELVEAVLELDEPYRTTILLRFFEERPPREIAARQGVSVDTVGTRLARGLERLRSRLDARGGGDRKAWLAVLLPLAERQGGLATSAAPALAGTVLMNAKLKIALALAAVAGGIAAWNALREAPARPGEVAAAKPATLAPPRAVDSNAAPAPAGSSSAPQAPASREIAPAAAPVPSAFPPASAPPAVLRGRVLDARGAALGGLRVVFMPAGGLDQPAPESEAVSAADGGFQLPLPGSGGRIEARQSGWTTVIAGVVRGRADQVPPVVVAAPALELAGRVVEATGWPLEGARVQVDLPEDFRARLATVLDSSVTDDWAASSDARGDFALPPVPSVEGAVLRASADGFLPTVRPLPAASDASLLLELLAPEEHQGLVRGRVVDASGAALEGALVAFGIDTSKTGEDGTFAFRREDPESFGARFGVEPEELVALKRPYQPARMEPPVVAGRRAWPSWVVLRLGEPALSISGTAYDRHGEARAGLQVWVVDSTTFGAVERGPAQVEHLLAGYEGGPWRQIATDARGRFEIDGLLEREYTLAAMDEDTLLRGFAGPVRAGSRDVVLRLPKDALHERVAGRLIGRDGKAIAGARVHPMCDAFQARWKGQVISTSHAAVEGTETDAEGRFELRDVPRSLVYLRIDGEDILPLEYGRYVEGDPRFVESAAKELPFDRIESLEIVVARRCHFQVELGDAELPDSVALLDEHGRRLELSSFQGHGRRDGPTLPIVAGLSEVIAGPDSARTLVLLNGDQEVGRRAIELAPGQVVKVRW